MSRADLEPRKTIERSFKDEVRKEYRGLQRISNRVAQTASSLKTRILCGARCPLRMHEQQDPQLLRLCPERIELTIGDLLTFDTSSDGGAAHSQFLDGLVQLVGSQIRMLQGHRRHSDKSIRMLGAPLRYFFILQLDEIASQCAVRRVSPGVHVDRLIVDSLRIHVDQPLRVAERNVTGEV